MRPLILLFTILPALAICSCHAQRHITRSDSTVTEETVSSNAAEVSFEASAVQSDFTGSLSGVSIVITADSVKKGDTVIYNPTISFAADSAGVTAKVNEKTELNDSACQEINSDKRVATNSDFSQSSKSVAIADTGSSFSWGLTIGISIIILLLFSWYYRKIHN